MRDEFIYKYLGVDYKIVWDIVLNKILELKGKIKEIIEKEGWRK